MKICSIAKCVSVAALAAACLPLAISSTRAVPAPATLEANGTTFQQAQPEPMDWIEAKRHKLRHAYWLLEQGDRDYHGHRAKAMAEIRKAGEIIGMDLHGDGYGGEHQKWSDARLREARGLLQDVVEKSGGREHEHIRTAIHELDRALEG